MDAAGLSTIFPVHLGRLFDTTPALGSERGASWWAVLTGEEHTDLNQCALLEGATVCDADALIRSISEAGVPAVVSVGASVPVAATEPLRSAGMKTAPLPEPLMWCDSPPPTLDFDFDVLRVTTPEELASAHQLCAEAHAIDEAIVARVLARDPAAGDRVTTWIAWDGHEPISVVWFTHGDEIGVWEMMTPPRHRRRGAARAVLTAALAASWTDTTRGAFLWASPAGRHLYESLGFVALDEPTIWYTPGHEAAALAVGQPA